ncbi:hypothetical protein BT93_J0800 [Corymbia citriodora subsp. variegata]|nr:hypothetical protein BT93_J0800 [Corymbia citriodora subsp. variegata]
MKLSRPLGVFLELTLNRHCHQVRPVSRVINSQLCRFSDSVGWSKQNQFWTPPAEDQMNSNSLHSGIWEKPLWMIQSSTTFRLDEWTGGLFN